MSNIYLYQFNNYYNKVVVKYDTAEEYGVPIVKCLNANFIPGDYLRASHIFNSDDNIEKCDYCLVLDENNNIVSRWYIMHHERTRAGQYKIDLLRDVMAEFRDEVMSSKAYIERGTIPASNPLIYNSENMQFNQIKKREDLLYDRSRSPWIVGYVPLNVTDLTDVSINFEGNQSPLTNYEEILNFAGKNIKVIEGSIEIQASIFVESPISYNQYRKYIYNIVPDSNTVVTNTTTVTQGQRVNLSQSTVESGPVSNEFTEVFRGKNEVIKGILSSNYQNIEDSNIYADYNNRIVKDISTGKYYSISVKNISNSISTISIYDTPNIAENIEKLILNNNYVSKFNSDLKSIYLTYSTVEYQLTLTPITYGDVQLSLTNHIHPKLHDAPYYMFCMKYTEKNYQLAMQLNTENQNKILDIQLLPYCPVLDYINDDGSYKLPTNPANIYYYEPIVGTSDYLFWATKSVFSFDINYIVDIDDVKISNECDMYRLCSPNGNGQFEFNAAKNNGVTKINVDCTYRPYDPYIHLNPDFGGLYGEDFNDFRGLILNGDFSIPAINDQWIQYTINNKNYQNIFNREIQSLDLQNKWAQRQDIFNAIVGGIGGIGTGAISGSMFGGIGAGIGAVAGGVLSGVAGGLDVYANEQLRKDQMDLKKQLFSYNLQNIQAIPQSVSKTGCLTNNNKLVPYVEYYTCTDEEKQCLKDKLFYTGMTIGVVGTISDFTTTGSGREFAKYIQADLIEIDIDEDYNITMEIANTLRGGVRIA